MKGLLVIALLFVTGCGAIQTLEELEAEANTTGDWSKVERREYRLSYRDRKDKAAKICNDQNLILFCDNRYQRGRFDIDHCVCARWGRRTGFGF